MTPSPAPLAPQTIDEILHDIFVVGITAASIFVKNPTSQQRAASIISLLNQTVLPIADNLLLAPAPAPTASIFPIAPAK